MTRIITFLGSTGIGHTVLAVASAQWFAAQGKQVLLVTQAPNATADSILETTLSSIPQIVAPCLQAVQLHATAMIERLWTEMKKLITTYVPTDLPPEIYAGELVILPGLDQLLTFNALREYYQSGDYEVIVYDGSGDLNTLRMLGIPDSLNWYFRRFHQVFESLSLGKIAESIGGPIASAFLTANLDAQKLKGGMNQVQTWIKQGMTVLEDSNRLTTYLVTSDQPDAIADSRWVWGSAQQSNLRVNGVLVYSEQQSHLPELQAAFAPLSVTLLPALEAIDWKSLLEVLPNFDDISTAPEPLSIDLEQHQIIVFLPGFTKKQVKLTQHGSTLTVEAGDQRRNIFLPSTFRDLSLRSGKFEDMNLVISFE
jgi:anion-transporting  ArsA/GET3 family ATPase